MVDCYDIPTYPKVTARETRHGGKPAPAYDMKDSTPVGNVSAMQFLSNTRTKDELTVYLVDKALCHNEGTPKMVIVTPRQYVLSNWIDVQHLCRFQEDTQITFHRLDAVQEVQNNPIFSHLTLTCSSLKSASGINYARTHISSPVCETESGISRLHQ